MILIVLDFWARSQLAERGCSSGYLQKKLGPNTQAMQLPLPPTKLTEHSTSQPQPAQVLKFIASLTSQSWQDTEHAK